MRKYRLKGHGGFFMREGWFAKGVTEVSENPRLFTKENYSGADALGVGSAMAKAIRYWMGVCGLIKEVRGTGTVLTEMGQLIAGEDLYLEDLFSVWLLHIHAVSSAEKATIWYLFFETMPLGEFTREQMQEKLYEELLRYSGENEVSERSFTDDCNTFLQMYVDSKEEKEDPEDKKRSVFARLRLIQKNYRGYRRERIVPERLPKEIVLLVLRRKILGKQGESIENLLTCENGPGKLLSLDRILFNEYLDELENDGCLRINRTAGLDMVYLSEEVPEELEIIQQYYEKRQEQSTRGRTV